MQKRTFSTFTAATNFARQHAQENCTTVKIQREGFHWAVFTAQGGASHAIGDHGHQFHTHGRQQYPPENSRWKHHIEKQRKREEQEQKRRRLEQKAREAELRECEKRRPYLEEKANYYRSLSEEELEKQWKQRKEMDIEPNETALLREIIREIKGIKPAYGNNAQVCPQCGMVGGNCTCGRSWF